jgi:hypothetical protein
MTFLQLLSLAFYVSFAETLAYSTLWDSAVPNFAMDQVCPEILPDFRLKADCAFSRSQSVPFLVGEFMRSDRPAIEVDAENINEMSQVNFSSAFPSCVRSRCLSFRFSGRTSASSRRKSPQRPNR